MIRNDYVMRLIELLGAFLQKTVANMDTGDFEIALEELEKASSQTVGFPLAVLENTPAEQVENLLQLPSGKTDYFRLMGAGYVLDARAQASFNQGEEISAYLYWLKSLYLLTKASRSLDEQINSLVDKKIEEILHRLLEFETPDYLSIELGNYFEHRKLYARAEDHWYEVEDKQLLNDFYQRMLDLSDAELIAGGLPREEIVEATSTSQESPATKD